MIISTIKECVDDALALKSPEWAAETDQEELEEAEDEQQKKKKEKERKIKEKKDQEAYDKKQRALEISA